MEKLGGVLAFAVGIIIGRNWPKIRKWLPAAKEKVLEMTETTKETMTDTARKVLSRGAGKAKRAAA